LIFSWKRRSKIASVPQVPTITVLISLAGRLSWFRQRQASYRCPIAVLQRQYGLPSHLIFCFVGAAIQSMSTGGSAWAVRKLKSIYPFRAPSHFAPSEDRIGLFNGRRVDPLLDTPLARVIGNRSSMSRRLSSALPTVHSRAGHGRKLVGSA